MYLIVPTHLPIVADLSSAHTLIGSGVTAFVLTLNLEGSNPKEAVKHLHEREFTFEIRLFLSGNNITRQQMCVEAGSLTSARLKYFEKNKMFSSSICFVTNGLFSFQTSNLALSDC